MEHDIDALATLNGVDSIPDKSHDCTVECRPPCSENSKGSSREDWIST